MPNQPLILASSSPRRLQLLQTLRIPFEVHMPNIDETMFPNERADDMVLRLAKLKASVISAQFPGRWILSSDGHKLGKPKNEQDAYDMLKRLQNRVHQVCTGLCLQKDDNIHALVETSNVFFRPMTDKQIHWYIKTGEPMDKAGAYAIQGTGGLFIEHFEGSYTNIMGLPIERMIELFQQLDLLNNWLNL